MLLLSVTDDYLGIYVELIDMVHPYEPSKVNSLKKDIITLKKSLEGNH